MSQLPRRGVAREVQGEEFQRSLEGWDKIATETLNRAYNDAFSAADVSNVAFGTNSLKSFMDSAERGVLTRGTDIPAPARATEPKGLSPQERLRFRNEQARQTGQEPTPQTVRAGFDVNSLSRLRSMAERVKNLPDEVTAYRGPEGDFSAFEFLKEFRSEAGRLTQHPDPEISAFANRLWGELSETLNNPSGVNSELTEEFLSKYRAANDLARDVNNMRQLSFISRALRTDTPSEIARKFMSPTNPELMRTLKETLPTREWENARGFFMSDLATNPRPRAALNQLDQWQAQSPEGFRAVMTEREETILRRVLNAKVDLDSSATQQALSRNVAQGQRTLSIINNGGENEIRTLVDSTGGKSGDTAASIRAAVWSDLLEKSSRASDIGESLENVINYRLLADNIKAWKAKNNNIIDVAFDEDSLRVLNDMQNYARASGSTASDVGGSMAIGEQRSTLTRGLGELATGDPNTIIRFLQKQLSNYGMASYLSRPVRYNSLNRAFDNHEGKIRTFGFELQQMLRNLGSERGDESEYDIAPLPEGEN